MLDILSCLVATIYTISWKQKQTIHHDVQSLNICFTSVVSSVDALPSDINGPCHTLPETRARDDKQLSDKNTNCYVRL